MKPRLYKASGGWNIRLNGDKVGYISEHFYTHHVATSVRFHVVQATIRYTDWAVACFPDLLLARSWARAMITDASVIAQANTVSMQNRIHIYEYLANDGHLESEYEF